MLELQEQVIRLRDQVIAANMDADKASVAALSKVVKEKDKQIEDLTEQIRQFVDEMEKNTAIIEDLQAELKKCKNFQKIFFKRNSWSNFLNVKMILKCSKILWDLPDKLFKSFSFLNIDMILWKYWMMRFGKEVKDYSVSRMNKICW